MNIIKVILLAAEALRHGKSLKDKAAWKNRAGAIIALTAVLAVGIKIAKVYGYDIPITDEELAGIAGTVVTFVGLYFNYATSTTVGVLPGKPDPADGMQPGGEAQGAPERDVSGPN